LIGAIGHSLKISYPPELPVSARRDDLLAAIRDHQVVVVAGETGSGKTTQLPKICLELGRGSGGMIAHTQPRRLAARAVAGRIAEELGVPLGREVGFAVRFDDRSGAETLVRVMTDGLLLAEIQRDRLLRRYDTIIVDEAHERSLNVDFLLGYVKRLLPERPDLKLVITSATIDPDRFARHFGDDVPVIEVSGRTYPVEVRYREPAAEQDGIDAIGDAVEELCAEGPGDVLVFLSGEREIRDTAEALNGRLGTAADVLPLYARLSNAEQQRIFQPHDRRRIVLATNVAETSLTVPGITYVVDPGTARISRYSARLKVQRLPIEPVSRASADQRKGRCGRESPGTCIRLYAEEDFEQRPEFTDPEILRTNLASVILQMAALGLGEVEDFPFLDPPDRRQIRDGVNLLVELAALDERRRLTPLGRRVARFPVDPRLARMIVEADRLGCVDEVMVIVAALSIQDPRERPADKQAQADQAHARFTVEGSDFLTYLSLWRYLREQQSALSGNQFRRLCKAEYLHHLRVREWQDLVAQLRQSARAAKVTRNRDPAEHREIHTALLSGLLSHVGLRDERRREYAGARNARFQLWPGSVLARKPPAWVMVAELVETSRLWGRTAAQVQPQWVEPLAKHLARHQYSEPRWDPGRAAVVATERVTVYGLPVVAGRTVPYARIDPALARELFIRRALVEGEWEAPHDFLEENRRRVGEVRALEDRARRRDLLVDDATLVRFFDERVPERVVSGRHFDRWWRDERRAHPELLVFPRSLLVRAEDVVDQRAFPPAWKQGDLVLTLSYRFEPGAEDDGVTVHVPLRALGQLQGRGFDWLVPGLRRELVTALLRSLPKEMRRPLVPMPEVVGDVLGRLTPRREPVVDAVAAAIEELRGVRGAATAFDLARLPAHLRMRFAVEDDEGTVLAAGRSLDALRAELRPRLRADLARAARALERSGMTAWPEDLPDLPRSVALPGTGGSVRAYPALADEGSSVAVRVLDTPEEQAAAMRAGTRRLLRLTVPSPLKWVQGRLGRDEQLALAAAPHGSVGAALEDATSAALDALVEQAGGPAWSQAAFGRLRDHVAGDLAETTLRVVRRLARVLDAEREVRRAMEGATADALQPAVRDVAAQAGRLVGPGFVSAAGAGRLADVERYLRGAARRLERLPSMVAADADRMRAVHELEAAYRERLAAWPKGRPVPDALREVPWLLEELRVSHFAQGLGVRGQVSSKRIRRLLDSVPRS
jgi:ATP-dependent helicase HrpA